MDGSYGEGGGSILRYALALSAVTMKPVEIYNIRAKRSNPGLRPQHLNAVRALAMISSAKVEGAHVGSMRVYFEPRSRAGGNFKVDIGTAGSISLIIQAILPAALFSERESKFTIKGGTDVRFAPPIDYMREVFLRNMKRLMGVEAEIRVIKRGHYPKGGGLVELTVKPSELKPFKAIEREEVSLISGRAHAVKLPRHVVDRIASSAESILRENGFQASVKREWSRNSHLGPGAGITLWTEGEIVIGGDSLGERGKPSEKVGQEAAFKILSELRTGMALDSHMGDMIIPYMALAEGESVAGISQLTMHAISNIWLTEKFLPVKFNVEGRHGGPAKVSVVGSGLS